VEVPWGMTVVGQGAGQGAESMLQLMERLGQMLEWLVVRCATGPSL
jgi:hypothetical protein